MNQVVPIKPPRAPVQQPKEESKSLLAKEEEPLDEDKDKDDGEENHESENQAIQRERCPEQQLATPQGDGDARLGVPDMDRTITQEEEFSQIIKDMQVSEVNFGNSKSKACVIF